MSQLERIYKIDRMLRRKQPPSRQELVHTLEISPAQLKRDFAFMRDRLGAPITFAANLNGYQYESGEFNLPGFWLSESEVYSLLLMYSLLDQLQPGFVREQLEPFETKLKALLGKQVRGAASILDRMHVTAAPQRRVNPEHFQAICEGTLRRKKLRMRYYTRYRGSETDRVVSPQRVIYYRGNWYLDAWCDDKKAPRRFAVDAVRAVSVLDEAAIDRVPDGDRGEGYGIFAGPAAHTAVLHFDAESARWVGEEEWHPCQRVKSLTDGGIQLEVPYSNPQEILMDILRHGAHVEVIQPASLRNAVAEAHQAAAAKYTMPKRGAAAARSAASSRTARTTQA